MAKIFLIPALIVMVLIFNVIMELPVYNELMYMAIVGGMAIFVFSLIERALK